MSPSSELELPADGPVAPPRANGELVFDAPWQSRAFGLAAALAEGGRLTWPAMQAALIDRVGEADATGGDTGTPTGYWTCWLEAIAPAIGTSSMGAQGDAGAAVDRQVWDRRAAEFAARPSGHDHQHDHGRSHHGADQRYHEH